MGEESSLLHRVAFFETDAMGIVFHGNYFTYLEVGRVDYLRNLGLADASRPIRDFENVVVAAHLDFKSPARLDDQLIIDVRTQEIRSSSFTFAFRIRHKAQNRVVASGYTLAFERFAPEGDLGMVAPRMLGPEVRRCYEEGVGFITAVGVQRDATGRALARTLALAGAIGGLRQGDAGLALPLIQPCAVEAVAQMQFADMIHQRRRLHRRGAVQQRPGHPLQHIAVQAIGDLLQRRALRIVEIAPAAAHQPHRIGPGDHGGGLHSALIARRPIDRLRQIDGRTGHTLLQVPQHPDRSGLPHRSREYPAAVDAAGLVATGVEVERHVLVGRVGHGSQHHVRDPVLRGDTGVDRRLEIHHRRPLAFERPQRL